MRKELLGWEKELVGFYVSEHPLTQVALNLQDTVTCFCGEINEEMNQQNVVVAGLVEWIRPHVTKRGDPMAFVHLEDIQGGIEVVVFPRVYEATRDLWQQDKILVVRGKVDAARGAPKILADSVQDYLLIAHPADAQGAAAPAVAEQPAAYALPARAAPAPPRQEPSAQPPANGGAGNGGSAAREPTTAQGEPRSPRQESPPLRPPPGGRHLNIVLRRTGDQAQDTQRARQVYNLLTGHPGSETFTLFVEDSRRRVQIDFPNASIAYSPDLAQSLRAMLGQDAVQVV